MRLDLFLIGVGGQGVLTIGEILAEAARRKGISVNVFPTEGMAQRGGTVRSEVRFGRGVASPRIRVNSADIVVGMELSESLRAVRFVRPGGHFVLYGHVWPPTEVMLGKADYPSVEQVREQIRAAGARLLYLDPRELPQLDNSPVPANIYVLGAAISGTPLGSVLDAPAVLEVLADGCKGDLERNTAAFEAGLRVMTPV